MAMAVAMYLRRNIRIINQENVSNAKKSIYTAVPTRQLK